MLLHSSAVLVAITSAVSAAVTLSTSAVSMLVPPVTSVSPAKSPLVTIIENTPAIDFELGADIKMQMFCDGYKQAEKFVGEAFREDLETKLKNTDGWEWDDEIFE